MKKKFIQTLSAILVGASLISCGTVIKASVVNNSTIVENDEVVKTKEIYYEILTSAQKYLYHCDAKDKNAEALRVWTEHLNEIYNELFNRLDNSKRSELEKSQTEWYFKVSEEAKKTSSEDEYKAYMAQATKERCFDLVSKYL